MTNNASQKKIKDIKLLISDVDGVLTDGTIYIGSDGTEFKNFSVEDGAGAAYARMAGLPIALISGRFSLCTLLRSKEMGIEHCYQGKLNKIDSYEELKEIFNVSDNQIAYIGDGLIDIPLLKRVGFPCSVPGAHERVKSLCDHITSTQGGRGAFREVVELILTKKGVYGKVYKKMQSETYKA
jgi:3-deoxy-D-manno-octulosonate 8-phosphate phosphatase (KDO 8-P phosphatase)